MTPEEHHDLDRDRRASEAVGWPSEIVVVDEDGVFVDGVFETALEAEERLLLIDDPGNPSFEVEENYHRPVSTDPAESAALQMACEHVRGQHFIVVPTVDEDDRDCYMAISMAGGASTLWHQKGIGMVSAEGTAYLGATCEIAIAEAVAALGPIDTPDKETA